MKNKPIFFLTLMVLLALVFISSQFVPGFRNELRRSFFEMEIDRLITQYEGYAPSSKVFRSQQEYETRISPASSYWKARYLRNEKERLVEELLASQIGIDPHLVEFFLHKRYFDTFKPESQKMQTSARSPNRQATRYH